MSVTDPKRIQAASSEVVRDINRRIVLNLIRTRQPISRADLARISGLQRSTISLIVEELIQDEWVLEGPTGRLPRGRRPTFLRLNEDRVIIGVDLRPTETTVALADVNGRFSFQEKMVTPADPKRAMEELVQRIRGVVRFCQGKKIEGIGISVPGRYDRLADRLVFAPNLNWCGMDIRNPIVDATGLNVELGNAANACMLAVVLFDHLEPCRNMVAVTVAEGIGTGLLINGQLARGLNGMAGEFGHVALDPDGPLCGCGSRGCWEVFASTRAALRYYLETASEPDGLGFLDLLRLADQGDARAARALETQAHYLGCGMRMVVAGLAPERIVVIGELTRSWHRFGPIIEAEVRTHVLPGGGAPQVVAANENGMARLRGTISLVLWNHFVPAHEATA
jgi:predicted NBD/HSP70 family sugar kinase